MTELLAMILIIFVLGGRRSKDRMPKHWHHKRTAEEDQVHKEEVLKFLKPY